MNTPRAQAGPRDGTSSGTLESLEKSVVLRFEQAAGLYPDQIAVKDHEQALTYRAFHAAVNAVAAAIIERCGAGEAPVAFLLGHDISSIITLMAILKAGRPYLALHPASPAELLKLMVSDTKPDCIVSDRRHEHLLNSLLPAGDPLPVVYLDEIDLAADPGNPGIYVAPESPFSIFYTSGSTGKPKGVVISHRFVIFCLVRHAVEWDLSPADRISLFVSNSFSASWSNILDGLLHGGTICLYDFKNHSAEQVLDWIVTEQINMLRLTPSMLRTIFDRSPGRRVFQNLRLVTLSGEPAKASDVNLFKAHTAGHCKLVNIFASTEAGVLATYTVGHQTALADDILPAGHPIPGHEIMLLDPDGQPVGPGGKGEIVIKSRYLASGYWNQPALTAKKFQPDPVDPDIKVLFTGDLGRWRDDGVLECLGRKDSQVKIRGYRVEISAIESLLHEEPSVKEAAVVARPARHQPGQEQLIAYVVPDRERTVTASSLRQALSARLPEYAVPAFFVFLDHLPLNVNGKVDRRALPDVPDRAALSEADLPESPLEEKLAGIWSALFNQDRVGVHDDFFELGGDSLLVLSMSLEVEKALGLRVPPSFFKQPTIRNLAGLLNQAEERDPKAGFVLQGHRDSDSGPAAGRPRLYLPGLLNTLNRLTKPLRRKLDESYFFEWILSFYVQRLTFLQAKQLAIRLADQPVLMNTVYWRKSRLFSRLLTTLGVPPARHAALFRLNFINNLLFTLVEARDPFDEARRTNNKRTPSVYAADRRRLIQDTPLDELEAHFAMEGFDHLNRAYARGRGVILLSFHGTAANRVTTALIVRRLGNVRIQTIAYNIALRQSRYWGTGLIWNERAGDMSPIFAEIAFHGQRLLQKGEVIHIAGDIGKGAGRKYEMLVGGRLYQVKAGFAELALNTGAQVLPIFGRFLEDGRLLTEILPPLEPGEGDRQTRIERLIRQYADFFDSRLRQHPEMMVWLKIKNHLAFRKRKPAAVPTPRSGS